MSLVDNAELLAGLHHLLLSAQYIVIFNSFIIFLFTRQDVNHVLLLLRRQIIKLVLQFIQPILVYQLLHIFRHWRWHVLLPMLAVEAVESSALIEGAVQALCLGYFP